MRNGVVSQSGQGKIKLGGPSKASFKSASRRARNQSRLIAAAHAGCFSMALAHALSEGGHAPTSIHTTATVQFGPVPGGFAISRIDLVTEGSVPGIDAATFDKFAAGAKENCPVSKALKAVEITLKTKFV
jgi:osmotically inducible protein OsmC